MAWLSANLVNIIVVAVVLVLAFFASRKTFRDVRSGKCDCGGSCASCGGCCSGCSSCSTAKH